MSLSQVHDLVRSLPINDLDPNLQTVESRVEWLIQQFRVMNMHHRGCYYSNGRWWCMRQCVVFKARGR